MNAKTMSQVSSKRLNLADHIPLSSPLVVYVEPSGYCNLKCTFCPQKTGDKKLKKDLMQKKIFIKMVDDISAFPKKIKLLRVCGNGEPLMNKNIVEMLQYAKERNIAEKIEMVTNGLLLDDNLIENLPKWLNRIIISVQGLSPEEYKKTSLVQINFEKFLANIKKLYSNRGSCRIHIKIHNRAIATKSAKKMFLSLFGNMCDEIYVENLVPLWPQFNSAYFVDEFRWGGGKITKRQVCAQIFKGIQVQADGEVVPCCVDWKRVNILGNISKDSLFKIWSCEKLEKLRKEHLNGNKNKMEPCKDCTMNDYCEFDNIDQYKGNIYTK